MGKLKKHHISTGNLIELNKVSVDCSTMIKQTHLYKVLFLETLEIWLSSLVESNQPSRKHWNQGKLSLHYEMFSVKCSNINNAESADLSITIYLAMTHYWSILWPQIPPLVFRPCHQKAFHFSLYRMWPHQQFSLCLRWAKRVHSLLSIQIHPEALSGRTKTNFNQNTFWENFN